MKFETKLWQRSEKSFATTIPQALLFLKDLNKKQNVVWEYDLRKNRWVVDIHEKNSIDNKETRFMTILWKRSQRSYATTIPTVVLMQMDEDNEHEIIWEFDKKNKKWIATLKEVGR